MRTAKVSGFSNTTGEAALIKGSNIAQDIPCPADYRIRAHLPRWLYALCQSKNLLPSGDNQPLHSTKSGAGLDIELIQIETARREPLGGSASEDELDEEFAELVKDEGVELRYTPANAQDYRYWVRFQHRDIVGDVYFDSQGSDYVRPPFSDLFWFQVFLFKKEIKMNVNDLLAHF